MNARAWVLLSIFAYILFGAESNKDSNAQALSIDAWLDPSDLPVVEVEKSPAFWEGLARERFVKDCKMFDFLKDTKFAKNAILLLGDGMGFPTIAAGRFYKAQQMGLKGEVAFHPMEHWPYNTLARTYDLEASVTDSASSATAYLTGTKTRTGMIGVTGDIKTKACGKWDKKFFTETVIEAAFAAGKATGVVTTTRITHASPSGCYGHVSFRDMESDADLKKFCEKDYMQMACQDLACQLVNDHPYINVIVGGGQKNFYSKDQKLPANESQFGVRLDGRNLVNEWIKKREAVGEKFCLIRKPNELVDCDANQADFILGLPYADHMPYVHQLKPDEPNLLEYVKKALRVLERQKNGYFLFVESGRIDHAHHENEGRRGLDEMKLLDDIMAYVAENVNLDETLVIVTADHSHSFEVTGRIGRFQNILGLDQVYSNYTLDRIPSQALNYMTGPNGLKQNQIRSNPATQNLSSYDYKQQALIPTSYAFHGGDDVGVYATGPMSHIFHTTIENTMIAHAMKLAIGVSPYGGLKKPCDVKET